MKAFSRDCGPGIESGQPSEVSVLESCVTVLQAILRAGNSVLIVSKPHVGCIERICRDFHDYREQILFRFSIGATTESILAYWEPGAPSFEERLACLRYAHKQGFGTSVSAEPLLDTGQSQCLADALLPYVTDSLWIGKMNQVRSRVVEGTDEESIRAIERGQTDRSVRAVYDILKHERKIRWKESYKAVLGLQLAETAGMDI